MHGRFTLWGYRANNMGLCRWTQTATCCIASSCGAIPKPQKKTNGLLQQLGGTNGSLENVGLRIATGYRVKIAGSRRTIRRWGTTAYRVVCPMTSELLADRGAASEYGDASHRVRYCAPVAGANPAVDLDRRQRPPGKPCRRSKARGVLHRHVRPAAANSASARQCGSRPAAATT